MSVTFSSLLSQSVCLFVTGAGNDTLIDYTVDEDFFVARNFMLKGSEKSTLFMKINPKLLQA